MKAVRGGGVKRGDVCYGMLRAAACVDESDHHALMYVWHGQTVREDRVGEASARSPLSQSFIDICEYRMWIGSLEGARSF